MDLYCPKDICEKFGKGEEGNAAARLEAFAWLRTQRVKKGDTVHMPDPTTGEYAPFTAERDLTFN